MESVHALLCHAHVNQHGILQYVPKALKLNIFIPLMS